MMDELAAKVLLNECVRHAQKVRATTRVRRPRRPAEKHTEPWQKRRAEYLRAVRRIEP